MIRIEPSREAKVGAVAVRRALPRRERRTVGAWCFADHYGPEDVRTRAGMDVAPPPHTGLSTVSWVFSGEIEHRDSAGVHAMVRLGELNLMTAGAGICHSEVSTADTTVLHGVQLWLALPEAARHGDRDFHHHVPTPVHADGATVAVFLGALAGASSPVPTATALVGAQIDLAAGAGIRLDVDPGFEHGVLVDTGTIEVAGVATRPRELAHQGVGRHVLTLDNPGAESARAVLIGGAPFAEALLMWCNFVGRTHDEIAEYRAQWQAESDRFGRVDGYRGPLARIPAPPLPGVRLRPRTPPTRKDSS